MPSNIAELAARHSIPEETAQAIYTEGHTDGRVAPRITGVQPKAQEIAKRLNLDLYHTANQREMSFSSLLEEMDPTDDRYADYVDDPMAPGGRRKMDAYERQLMIADIRTKPDMVARIPAHTVERFYQSDSPSSSILFPEFINRSVRAAQMDESVLDVLVGTRTLIDGSRYTAYRLNWNTEDLRLQRVAEGSDMRTVSIRGLEETIRLHKYGVVIDMTYEASRRMALDVFARHLQMIAQQNDLDKAALALDTLLNGDGNANTAAEVIDINGDLGGTAGTLDAVSFMKFAAQFRNRYQMTTVLGQEASIIELLTMPMGNNMMFLQFQALAQGTSIRTRRPLLSNITTEIVDGATADTLIGLDARYALEMVSEIGADLTETDKIIRKQLNEVVISEVVGFAVMDPDAAKVLDVST